MCPRDGDNFNHEIQDHRRRCITMHSRGLGSSAAACERAVVREVGASRGTTQSIVRGL